VAAHSLSNNSLYDLKASQRQALRELRDQRLQHLFYAVGEMNAVSLRTSSGSSRNSF